MYQPYVSPELTHFVGSKKKDDEERYSILVAILSEGLLTGLPGVGGDPEHAPSMIMALVSDRPITDESFIMARNSVCFCDIPLDSLGLHMTKYSRFGLSFLKDFLLRKGANPVYYVASRAYSPGGYMLGDQFDEIVNQYRSHMMALYDAIREQDAVGDVSPELRFLQEFEKFFIWEVLNRVKVYDDSLSKDDVNNYYMEREWRTHGFVRFQLADVHRVIVPRRFVDKLRGDLPAFTGDITEAESLSGET